MLELRERQEVRPDWMDHPAHKDWWAATILQSMDDTHRAALTEQFSGSGEDVDQLITAAETATYRTNIYRQNHELEGIHRISDAISRAELAKSYPTLAGRPEEMGRYTQWFGKAATAALANANSDTPPIALELGGKQQNGDWDCVGELDSAIQEVPNQIHAIEPEVQTTIARRCALRFGHLFLPLFIDPGNNGNDLSYGILRRRQAVMDIQLPKQQRIEVFRQSHGLVVVSELGAKAQKNLRESNATKKNSPAANMMGHEYEIALINHGSTTIVPLNTVYVMKVRAAA